MDAWMGGHDVTPFTQTRHLALENLYLPGHIGADPDDVQDNQGVRKYSKQSCLDTWPQMSHE